MKWSHYSNPQSAAAGAKTPNPFRGSGQRSSGVINIEQLAEMFELPSWDDIEELNEEYIFDATRGAESEEEAMKAQEEAASELYRKWHDSVESVAESLFAVHGLVLTPKKHKGALRPYEYKVEPKTDWRDAANKIRETINGVGYFHFTTLQEFLDSGPWTAREATLGHLHWTKRYPEVFGESSARRIFDAAWR